MCILRLSERGCFMDFMVEYIGNPDTYLGHEVIGLTTSLPITVS